MGNTNKPLLRFKGFTDTWEQCKFKDLAETKRGLTYKPADVSTNGIRVLRSSNINEDYFEQREDDVFVAQNAINIEYAKSKDILITSANGSSRLVGKHAIITNIADNSAVHGGFMLLARTDYPYFLNSSMSSRWYEKFINLYVAGGNGAIGNLSKSNLDDYDILAPSVPEKLKVGELFKSIDSLITLHQRKFDKLVNTKKALLEKMFPIAGEEKPRLRFKGFTETWEQCKFKDVFVKLQNNSLSRADLNDEFGYAMNVHYGDVLIKFGEILDVQNESIPYISEPIIIEKYKNSFLQNGDIIIADAAEDNTVGKCCEIAGLSQETVLSGLHTIPCRPSKKFAGGYLGYYMNSNVYHDQLLPLIQGSKISSISINTLANTSLVYPKSIDEQLLIANKFRALDNLITLHHRKYEMLQNIKKALLQKMFV